QALANLLGVTDLEGWRFLDIGSGSGLSSLAARRLGAQVHSFDYDPESVACTAELRRRFAPDDPEWTVEQGSALDADYLRSLGPFDIVYSWGVLHHTGAMEQALANALIPLSHNGLLVLALYNDQGWISRYWTAVKRTYNRGPAGRAAMIALHAPYLLGARWLARALTGRLRLGRGMSLWHDMLDWLGGYPFEVASPARVIDFYRRQGLVPESVRGCGRRHGCNEFVFRRS
ncbi:MAG: class I SAM-dependent methyltransferase, partial [Gammaproteobacteria bacterium]